MASKKGGDAGRQNIKSAIFIFAYLFEWLSGIIVYVLAEGNKREKLHAMQAIVLGVCAIAVSIIFGFTVPVLGALLGLLIWVYGLYVGFKAYNGVDVEIPIITDFVKKNLI